MASLSLTYEGFPVHLPWKSNVLGLTYVWHIWSLTDEGFLVHLLWKSNVLGRPRAFGSRLRWMSPTSRQLSEEATNTLSIIWGKPINKQLSIINYLMSNKQVNIQLSIIWGGNKQVYYQLSSSIIWGKPINKQVNILYVEGEESLGLNWRKYVWIHI